MRQIFIVLLLPALLSAQTEIKRSVRPGVTAAVATPASITISGSTMTTSALPDSIGVGDAVQYDSTGADATINAIVFIHGRTSSTSYTVKRANGGTPPSVTDANTASVFGCYAGSPSTGSAALAAWESGNENTGIAGLVRNFDAGNVNIQAANQVWHVACYRGNDSANVIIDGWDTAASNYIRIFTPYLSSDVGVSQRHTGKYGTGYRISTADEGQTVIHINDDSGTRITYHVRMDGLVIFSRGQSGVFINSTGDDATADIRVSNCIIRGSNNASAQASHSGIYIWDNATGGTRRIWNNIIYDFFSTGTTTIEAAIYHQHGTTYAYHNTATSNAIGYKIELNGQFTLKNNIANDNTDNYSGTFGNSWGITHNITDVAADTTVFSVAGESNNITCEVTFVDEANDDFRLSSSDPNSCARDNGTNLTADANIAVNTSIEVVSQISRMRPQGAAVDIGASEVLVSTSSNKYWRRRLIR